MRTDSPNNIHLIIGKDMQKCILLLITAVFASLIGCGNRSERLPEGDHSTLERLSQCDMSFFGDSTVQFISFLHHFGIMKRIPLECSMLILLFLLFRWIR